jgi:hypothetical protein
MDKAERLVGYVDWSDREYLRYYDDHSHSKIGYAAIEWAIDADIEALEMHLKRGTKAKQHMLLILDNKVLAELYATLKERFEPESGEV